MTTPLYFIIGTHSHESRGGISSSLEVFEQSFEKLDIKYVRINSHSEERPIFSSWLKALWHLIAVSREYTERRRVYWYHCGPWFSMLRKFVLALASKAMGGENVVHFHSYSLQRYLSSRFGRGFLQVFLLPFDKVITLTPWWQGKVSDIVGERPIATIPNPISFSLLEQAKSRVSSYGAKKNGVERVNIFTMARLAEGKGVEQVIEAMKLLPDFFYLTIAGDGPIKEELIAKVEAHQLLDRVKFTGWLDVHEKEKMLCKSDVFCLPSYDSFGLVFIEAMSVGLPVVALNSGPVSDVVTDDAGILLEFDSPQEVSAALKKIIYHSQSYRDGPKRVSERYNPIELTKRLIKFLDQ